MINISDRAVNKFPRPTRLNKTWSDPQKSLRRLVLEDQGILPSLVRTNPELSERILDFFLGRTKVLIIGGESGMGKSLISVNLRRLARSVQPHLPPKARFDLAVISWDRVHQAFFEELSTELGTTVEAPKGETDVEARKKISLVQTDAVRFATQYLGSNTKVILESPLVDHRGEVIFDELSNHRAVIQTLIMHSPKVRYETLQKGRLIKTSGQPDSMVQIRSRLIQTILGRPGSKLSDDEQDEIVKRWWERRLPLMDGLIVDWGNSKDRPAFNRTVREYKKDYTKPDLVTPRSVSRFIRRQFESVFEAIPDQPAFTNRLAKTESGSESFESGKSGSS